MKKQIINEGLDYLDMVGQIEPTVSVDEYAAKAGTDSDVVTLAFTVNSEAAGEDLVNWFERGYDWILDASVSEGELTPGIYLVFVEMKRRIAVPGRIIELIEGLETLTDLTVDDWTVIVDGKEYNPEEHTLKEIITISPHEYREENENEGELNEMRKRAGLETVNLYGKPDRELQAYIAMAGL
jgi:ABC-type Fe3+-hydroxamate transport system substrate-binding protein